MSAYYWLRKYSSSSILPHPPSEFLQARCRFLLPSVFLGGAAIFGHEENNDLQDSQRAGSPSGEKGYGEGANESAPHILGGEAIEEVRNYLSGEFELWEGTTSSGVVVLEAAILTLAAAFFLCFPGGDVVAAVDLGSGFLSLAVFLVAV
jgi:hypothetical protein